MAPASHRMFLKISFFLSRPPRPKASALAWCCARPSSRRMAAVSGWARRYAARRSTSRCPSRTIQMSDPARIALIDDDAAVLDSLRLYLSRQNLNTAGFSSAEDFLTALDGAALFDCVVSDVRMRGLSGLELLERLSARGVHLPIILITGHG